MGLKYYNLKKEWGVHSKKMRSTLIGIRTYA